MLNKYGSFEGLNVESVQSLQIKAGQDIGIVVANTPSIAGSSPAWFTKKFFEK